MCASGLPNIVEDGRRGLSRREIGRAILAAMGSCVLISRNLRGQVKDDGLAADADADEIARVSKLAKNAGIDALGHAKSDHFLCLGDAPESFQREALKRCEALGDAFLMHFRGRGFTPVYPNRRMTIIALKNVDSYEAILSEVPGKNVGGHYDLETNRLVIFDFRAQRANVTVGAERVNLFTLVHETAHQLCFNTGIAERDSDVPMCISEGLATYVELWRPGVKNSIGGLNQPRLRVLRDVGDWIPMAVLVADDKAFEQKTQQLAYAESWLLVHHLLRSQNRATRLREYLSLIRGAKRNAQRLRIAEQALGPISKLDKLVKDEARMYLRG
jgi:hypothetical protein